MVIWINPGFTVKINSGKLARWPCQKDVCIDCLPWSCRWLWPVHQRGYQDNQVWNLLPRHIVILIYVSSYQYDELLTYVLILAFVISQTKTIIPRTSTKKRSGCETWSFYEWQMEWSFTCFRTWQFQCPISHITWFWWWSGRG